MIEHPAFPIVCNDMDNGEEGAELAFLTLVGWLEEHNRAYRHDINDCQLELFKDEWQSLRRAAGLEEPC